MVVSYKEIVNQISGVCMSHRQVSNFDYGDFYKKMKGNIYNYPLCFLTDSKSKIVGSEVSLNFTFFVMDKLIHDETNELNVLSNCLDIGLDIIGELQYKSENWFLDYSSIDFSPFIDNMSDVLGGFMFSFTIKINEAFNSCDAPFTT